MLFAELLAGIHDQPADVAASRLSGMEAAVAASPLGREIAATGFPDPALGKHFDEALPRPLIKAATITGNWSPAFADAAVMHFCFHASRSFYIGPDRNAAAERGIEVLLMGAGKLVGFAALFATCAAADRFSLVLRPGEDIESVRRSVDQLDERRCQVYSNIDEYEAVKGRDFPHLPITCGIWSEVNDPARVAVEVTQLRRFMLLRPVLLFFVNRDKSADLSASLANLGSAAVNLRHSLPTGPAVDGNETRDDVVILKFQP